METNQSKKSNILKIFILFSIIGAGTYYYITQPDSKDKYKVKAASGDADAFGWRATFINLTGKDAEEKKIGLSDDYWTSGKFK